MFTKSMLTALAVLGLAGPAAAQSGSHDPDTVSIRVRYADLDLAREPGTKVMLRRIRTAAEEVCEPVWDDILDYYRGYNECVKAATDSAVGRLGDPLVTSMNGGGDQRAAAARLDPRS